MDKLQLQGADSLDAARRMTANTTSSCRHCRNFMLSAGVNGGPHVLETGVGRNAAAGSNEGQRIVCEWYGVEECYHERILSSRNGVLVAVTHPPRLSPS